MVVDPEVPGLANLPALGTLFAKYPAVPVIAYVTVSANGMHGSLALAAFGVRHVILRGYDDHPAAFRATVERACADTVSASLLERLSPARARLPGPLDMAIVILFRAPHTVRGAAAFARLAGMAPRTCSRALQRAGLASALLFVRAARVIRALSLSPGWLRPGRRCGRATGVWNSGRPRAGHAGRDGLPAQCVGPHRGVRRTGGAGGKAIDAVTNYANVREFRQTLRDDAVPGAGPW